MNLIKNFKYKEIRIFLFLFFLNIISLLMPFEKQQIWSGKGHESMDGIILYGFDDFWSIVNLVFLLFLFISYYAFKYVTFVNIFVLLFVIIHVFFQYSFSGNPFGQTDINSKVELGLYLNISSTVLIISIITFLNLRYFFQKKNP